MEDKWIVEFFEHFSIQCEECGSISVAIDTDGDGVSVYCRECGNGLEIDF